MNMMKDGMNINQRDIILIPFPYTDLSQNKKRPAIILSNNEHNSKNQDLICCAITSNPREYVNSVKFSFKDLDIGNLPFESRAKPNKIFTLNKNLIIKRLAKLNINKSKEIINSLNFFIKIDE
ncbi:MAG: type II toxin-antitoxin system PemK/MazF family toxin [Nanoarchaeota archaeon]